jgi:hypothetical protein
MPKTGLLNESSVLRRILLYYYDAQTSWISCAREALPDIPLLLVVS